MGEENRSGKEGMWKSKLEGQDEGLRYQENEDEGRLVMVVSSEGKIARKTERRTMISK